MRSPKTVLTVVLVATAMLLGLAAQATAQPAAGSDRDHRFRSGKVYKGSFPDPDVFRLGRIFYAFGTTIGGRSLPMMTSLDGRVWRARRALPGRRWSNDAMVGLPHWAAHRRGAHGRFVATWAPAVGRASSGRWVAAYAAPLRHHPRKRCVGLAWSRRPGGPYHQARHRPVVCPRHEGAIDPDIFRVRGRTYLLWKTEGIVGRRATTIRVRELRRNGRGFRPGTHARTLLRTARPWEQPVIENPSMIRYRGRLYLFYSGNRWYSRRYAVGYAVCRTVHGPCHRPQRRPLLAGGRRIAGPGGASAFRGPRGQLLLGYAAWPAGRVGSERRLHVARLKARPHGRLAVAQRFWRR